tara:strand:- start:5191 stop:5391 length:201 start_codon:yes stop_codon:yes gene_type:complete
MARPRVFKKLKGASKMRIGGANPPTIGTVGPRKIGVVKDRVIGEASKMRKHKEKPKTISQAHYLTR